MLVLCEARFGCDTWAHVVGIPIRFPSDMGNRGALEIQARIVWREKDRDS